MEQGTFSPENGKCKGHPTEWWFPLQKTGRREELLAIRQNTEKAKDLCHVCPVAVDCLDYSLKWEPWGIWGGYDEQTRATMRWSRKVTLGREGRIVFRGIGVRDANGGDFLDESAIN